MRCIPHERTAASATIHEFYCTSAGVPWYFDILKNVLHRSRAYTCCDPIIRLLALLIGRAQCRWVGINEVSLRTGGSKPLLSDVICSLFSESCWFLSYLFSWRCFRNKIWVVRISGWLYFRWLRRAKIGSIGF